jgi:hypothetical protein
MAGEKVKLEEEAISEILIADTRLQIKKCFPTRESQSSEIIHPPALSSVFFSWPEKGHSVQMRQMWCGPMRGALFSGISHHSKFINHPNCEYFVSW